MTTEMLRRYLCDAPHCPAAEIDNDPPVGWTLLSSTDHFQPYRTPSRGRGSRAVTYSDRRGGAFVLHLCPEHPHVFDGHRPMTDGAPGVRGKDPSVTVRCSCGASLGWCPTGWQVAPKPAGPSDYGHALWWRHLPDELRWYAVRGAAVTS